MNNTITITPRRLLVIGLFGLLAVLSYGFAAANTFPSGAGAAGDGQASISGYAVTNVHYTLSSTNPTMVDSISFTLTPALPAGGATRISLDAGATWLAVGACTGTTNVSCTATGTLVTALNNLRVVAAQ